MNICLYGGTFNPIHLGHLEMCKKALEKYSLDRIYIIPAGNSYFKNNVESSDVRSAMVKLALCDIDNPAFIYSDVEIVRNGPSYSYETVLAYKKLLPDDSIFFLIGEDTVFNIEKWMKPEIIFQNCKIIVAERFSDKKILLREKLESLNEKMGCDYTIMNFSMPISSSQIRNNIYTDSSLKKYLTPSVYDYILQEKLYNNGNS